MNIKKALPVTIGITAVALFAVACNSGESSTTGETPLPQQSAPVVVAPVNQASIPVAAPAVLAKTGPVAAAQAVSSVASSASLSGAPTLHSPRGNSGIWVSGVGSVTLEPDLAMLNLGVETTGKTVAVARAEAATAMDAMVTSLKSNGIAAIDIQTQFFNISPQYQWTEVLENGIRTSKQVLTGYLVTNNAAIKIRDMENVGPIIDEVSEAGGDAARINGISFTVEDTSPLMVSLRADAVADAIAKANQFANLTGVDLGRLVFISETGGNAPQIRAFPEADFAMAVSSFAPSTSISGGELEITVSVQAVFGIQ